MSEQDILRSIREQASRKIAEIRGKVADRQSPPLDIPLDFGKKSANDYLSDLSARIQDVAGVLLQSMKEDSDFVNSATDAGGNVIIYPNNCKLLIDNRNYGVVIIEEAPQMRTIFTRVGEYRVPLPYVVFIIGYSRHGLVYQANGNFGVGYGKKPIKSIDDRMLYPRLPHVDGNEHVCQPMLQHTVGSLAELVEASIGIFWQSKFVYNFRDFMVDGKTIFSYREWEELGKNNPLDILNGDFGQGLTVREVLKNFGGAMPYHSYNKEVQGAVVRLLQEINGQLTPEQLADKIRQEAVEYTQTKSALQST